MVFVRVYFCETQSFKLLLTHFDTETGRTTTKQGSSWFMCCIINSCMFTLQEMIFYIYKTTFNAGVGDKKSQDG